MIFSIFPPPSHFCWEASTSNKDKDFIILKEMCGGYLLTISWFSPSIPPPFSSLQGSFKYERGQRNVQRLSADHFMIFSFCPPPSHICREASTSNEDKEMCRDYLRNVCKRGKKCKFFHPDGMPPKTTTELIFCHDFQNKECSRQRCKFIHCSREEEEHFRLTGELKLAEVRGRERDERETKLETEVWDRE